MTRCLLTFLSDQGPLPAFDQAGAQSLVDAALAADGLTHCELTVRFVDDDTSAALHGRYFDDPHPTDVMSFPDGSVNPENGRHLLGDLAIGQEVAARRAAARDCAIGDELLLYLVHGLLHLLGHDDIEPEDRSAMWAEQARLLAQVGIDIGPED